LGISWNSQRDELIYTVKPIKKANIISKRYILSEISKIFDPLGLLAPVMLASKVIIQQCWKANVSWDESVPADLYTQWKSFSEQLELIDYLPIERNISISDPVNIQIHGFCDASLTGYGACLYVRSCNDQGEVRVRLFCAKGRVAPIDRSAEEIVGKSTRKKPPMTIPRLELSGALILARLFREVRAILTFLPEKIVFWSDSTIVLHWLKKSPDVLKIFEAVRVREIQEITGNSQWRHVRSEHNPADALSRSQLPQEFLNSETWFHGPSWLSSLWLIAKRMQNCQV